MAMSVTYTNFGGMLVHENRGGTESQYVPDSLGSLVGSLDTGQSFTYKAEYWPYGELQSETGTNTSSWSFVGLLGYFRDRDTLSYIRARHYLPGLARWLTVDPAWPSQLAYQYVFDCPIIIGDYSGKGIGQTFGIGSPIARPSKLGMYWTCLGCARDQGGEARGAGRRACESRGIPETDPRYDECDSNGYGNAVRHCVWSCLMSQECGSICSEFVGISHEDENYGTTDPNLALDTCYDLYNNYIGRLLAGRPGKDNCEQRCNKALNGGGLATREGKCAKIDCNKWRPNKRTDWDDYVKRYP